MKPLLILLTIFALLMSLLIFAKSRPAPTTMGAAVSVFWLQSSAYSVLRNAAARDAAT